jgi:hypothetical protein
MKSKFLLFASLAVTVSGYAHNHRYENKYHGNREWRDDDEKKEKVEKSKHYHYTSQNVHLPAKVSASFIHDYPSASNATWIKSNGNWKVRFNDGVNRKVVVYHANGNRLSTNTYPRKTVTTTPAPNPANYGGKPAAPATTTQPNPANYGGVKRTLPSNTSTKRLPKNTTTQPNPANYGGKSNTPSTTPATQPNPANYGGVKR